MLSDEGVSVVREKSRRQSFRNVLAAVGGFGVIVSDTPAMNSEVSPGSDGVMFKFDVVVKRYRHGHSGNFRRVERLDFRS